MKFNTLHNIVRAKKSFKKVMYLLMQNLIISCPDAIRESETVDFVALPPDDSFGIEKGCVYIPSFTHYSLDF